jgi:hypothetical protein
MSPLALWRAASRPSRVFAGLGLAAGIVVLALPLIPVYRAQARPSMIVGAMLIGFSLWLLIEGYRPPVRRTRPPKPLPEANEAVMPVPDEALRSAIGRDST